MDLNRIASLGGNNTAGDLVSALTGNVNKAYVLFHKPVDTGGRNRANEQSVLQAGDTDGLQSLAGRLQSKINSEAARGKRGAASNLFGVDASLVTEARQDGYIPMKVQYNPKSIRFTGAAGIQRRDSPDNQGLSTVPTPAETKMHVELMFDDTNVKDAFMFESLNVLSVGGLVQKGEQAVSALRGKEYSVRDLTELFVAAISFSKYRVMAFVWNKMIFWGEVTYVNVQYSMFSKAGNPIRAKVSLDMRQDMPEGQNEYSTEKYWRKSYEDMFQTKYQNTATGSENPFQNFIQW